MTDATRGKWTSATVRAKHKEFLFPSVGTFYEEQLCLESGKGARLTDLDGRTYLDFFGGILFQVIQVSQQPSQAPMLLLSWAFAIEKIALLVRVLSSWFPISPYSKWIRWSYVLTDWMIIPLGRLIPRIGMIDISPIVAWLLLSLLQRMLGIP